jgi:hypothetical protein
LFFVCFLGSKPFAKLLFFFILYTFLIKKIPRGDSDNEITPPNTHEVGKTKGCLGERGLSRYRYRTGKEESAEAKRHTEMIIVKKSGFLKGKNEEEGNNKPF